MIFNLIVRLKRIVNCFILLPVMEVGQFVQEAGEPEISSEEREKLEKQNSRLVPEFKAQKFQKEAQKHWDIFYKVGIKNH